MKHKFYSGPYVWNLEDWRLCLETERWILQELSVLGGSLVSIHDSLTIDGPLLSHQVEVSYMHGTSVLYPMSFPAPWGLDVYTKTYLSLVSPVSSSLSFSEYYMGLVDTVPINSSVPSSPRNLLYDVFWGSVCSVFIYEIFRVVTFKPGATLRPR